MGRFDGDGGGEGRGLLMDRLVSSYSAFWSSVLTMWS